MLAAAPQAESQILDLFCLALSLARQGKGNIPSKLADRFNLVISQARTIVSDSSFLNGDIMPEAIELALEMQVHSDIADTIVNIDDIKEISPEAANIIIQKMERSLAFSY